MTQLVNAIDVSGFNPRDLSDIIRTQMVPHVVVKLYLPDEVVPAEHSRAQVASARSAGCSVGGYVFGYRANNPEETVQHAVDLARSCDLNLPVLWIDCETYVVGGVVRDPGPDVTWLRAAVLECRALGVQPGIYTGRWWWNGFLNNTIEFGDLPLWTAEYDGIANPAKAELYGGWAQASGKQWSATGVDRDVFLPDVCSPGPHGSHPTLEDLRRTNPNVEEQLTDWQGARARKGEDPHDYPAFRTHLIQIGAPDPGPVEFIGFLRPTLAELKRTNPNIGTQLAEWQGERIRNGEDPHDYPAFRAHVIAIGAPEPGTVEFIGFRG